MRIQIVNDKDEIIGYKDHNDRDPQKDIFRVTGLWITAGNGDILLAQRSFKTQGAGLWGPAVAGTVEEGETYESNILKEAEEEIGLVGIKPIIDRKMKSVNNEYFIQWFTAIVDRGYSFKKQDEEVEAVQWFKKEEIVKLLKEKPRMFLPYLKQYFNFFIKRAD
ncbi:MAG TPA: NUDIX hydrolase [Candidatus Paceibacterota bacterium]|nr:NUDIX hydrolase [Candidatus Paceibacterota bacterium]